MQSLVVETSKTLQPGGKAKKRIAKSVVVRRRDKCDGPTRVSPRMKSSQNYCGMIGTSLQCSRAERQVFATVETESFFVATIITKTKRGIVAFLLVLSYGTTGSTFKRFGHLVFRVWRHYDSASPSQWWHQRRKWVQNNTFSKPHFHKTCPTVSPHKFKILPNHVNVQQHVPEDEKITEWTIAWSVHCVKWTLHPWWLLLHSLPEVHKLWKPLQDSW